MNARRVNAAAGVILAAQKQRVTAAGIAAALEAAGLLQSPESAASPWERAVAGLNALVDADVIFHVEPDGHISAPFSDEHIEWDLKARRWVLTRDDDYGVHPNHPAPCRVPESPDCTCPVEDPHDSPLHHSYALGRDLPEVTPEPPAVTVARWNAAHFVGTPVTAYPGRRPEDDPKCTRLVTHTRSAASVLGGHTAVVWVDGHSACIKLTHVDPRPGGTS
ncbi:MULTISPECIES: hypothetical protein [unclassified Streptomyces]|uniref:hypothetical protein n=1 Tax=unclassified Streptomyces TaxID=2593676 RepID=UPI0024A7BB44|nr:MULTISPECIES: hypothetical protein [unclassified Streptomyces]